MYVCMYVAKTWKVYITQQNIKVQISLIDKAESRKTYCAFQNSEIQKQQTHKTDRNRPITNHKPWPFEPVEVTFCFLRGPLESTMSSDFDWRCRKPKIPRCFWHLRSRVIQNSCNNFQQQFQQITVQVFGFRKISPKFFISSVHIHKQVSSELLCDGLGPLDHSVGQGLALKPPASLSP